jgi:hypothetical protein
MSNTSTVTPYDNRDSGNSLGGAIGTTAVLCAGAVVGAAGLAIVGTAAAAVGAFKMARWLVNKTQVDREAMAQLEDGVEPVAITTLNLHLQEPHSLVSTAATLGYHSVSDAELSVPTGASTILLQNSSGGRLAVTKNADGRLDIHTAGDRGQLHALVRQHTLDRTLAHLAAKGMTVQTASLANGELQILAHESNVRQPGGAAEVRAQVRTDGTTYVDIDKCRGNQCEAIVSGLAQAIGGTVSGATKKDAYFQLPGEPTKTQVKV